MGSRGAWCSNLRKMRALSGSRRFCGGVSGERVVNSLVSGELRVSPARGGVKAVSVLSAERIRSDLNGRDGTVLPSMDFQSFSIDRNRCYGVRTGAMEDSHDSGNSKVLSVSGGPTLISVLNSGETCVVFYASGENLRHSVDRPNIWNCCYGAKLSASNRRAFHRTSNLNSVRIPGLISRAFATVSLGNTWVVDKKIDGAMNKCFSLGELRSALNLTSRFSNGYIGETQIMGTRAFCTAENSYSETEDETDEYGQVHDKGDESVESADPKEVERVCKVIEDLFAADRNMEAVLNQCGVNLSHTLVLEVLSRFRHAWKPSFRFFCWAREQPSFSHNSQTCNLMMSILGKTRQFESMVVMLEEMSKEGLLTIDTFVIAIRAFAAAREMKKAVGMFELMKRYNFKADLDTFNCLLDALGRAKLGKEAHVLFEKMNDWFPPDLRTYSVLLAGWCKVKNLVEAGKVWNEMVDKGLKPDIVAHNIMLDGLFRGRRWSEAIKLFELMKAKGPSPNVRSYTIVIRDLCKGNKMDLAVEFFDEMLASGSKPDAAVYTCLIVGFGNQKKMDKVYGLLREMREMGCPPDVRTYNAIIKLMTNRNMPDDAVRIYKKMTQSGFEPTIHTYNMMMKSYFRSKNYDMGRAVWEEMGKKGFCPDDNSYIVFIGGLISQGSCEEACQYIEEMINKGMKAPQLDYNKFVADFSRAGKTDILAELAQKMKFSGKFEVANFFARWSEMMKKRVKRRN